MQLLSWIKICLDFTLQTQTFTQELTQILLRISEKKIGGWGLWPEGCAWGVGYGRGITLKGSLLIRREVYFACYQFKGCSRNEVFFFSWLKGRLPRTPRNGDEDDLSRISCSWDGLWNTMAYNVISCKKIERNTQKNQTVLNIRSDTLSYLQLF